MHGQGWWHGGGMWFWWGLVILAIVAVVWALSRRPRDRGVGGASAEETLKKRYANGEIDEETYERKLKELRA